MRGCETEPADVVTGLQRDFRAPRACHQCVSDGRCCARAPRAGTAGHARPPPDSAAVARTERVHTHICGSRKPAVPFALSRRAAATAALLMCEELTSKSNVNVSKEEDTSVANGARRRAPPCEASDAAACLLRTLRRGCASAARMFARAETCCAGEIGSHASHES